MGQAVVSNMSRWYANGAFFEDQGVVWPFNTFAPAALLATLVKFGSSYSSTYISMIREIMARVYDTSMGNGLAFDTPGFLPYGGYPRLPSPDSGHTISGDAQLAMYDSYLVGPTRASMQALPANRFGVDGLNVIESCHPLAFMIYQLPATAITTAERALWTSWCQAMCDFLDDPLRGNLTYFYVNGNYQARLCQAYWYTAMISSPGTLQDKYRDMYERAMVFMVEPTLKSNTWAGYGWKPTVTGGYGDWSDWEGYLTENYPTNPAGNGPGFDWGYSVTASDALAGIYLMNRDIRILRILNAIAKKVEPRWDQTRWILDGTGGSRQSGNNYGMAAFYPILQALLARKQSNTTMVTNTKILDYWDHSTNGDGGVTNLILLPTATPNAFYGTAVMSQWYSTVALTREAAYQARIKVPAV